MLFFIAEKHADDSQASFHKEERKKNTWLALFCLISRIKVAKNKGIVVQGLQPRTNGPNE
jgi:hypothetical protein